MIVNLAVRNNYFRCSLPQKIFFCGKIFSEKSDSFQSKFPVHNGNDNFTVPVLNVEKDDPFGAESVVTVYAYDRAPYCKGKSRKNKDGENFGTVKKSSERFSFFIPHMFFPLPISL